MPRLKNTVPDERVSIAEASRLLGLTDRDILRLVARNQLSSYEHPGIKISRRSIVRLIAGRASAPADDAPQDD